MLATLALAVALSTAPHTTKIARPDPDITPGETRDLSLKTVCETAWGKDVRHVSEKMRREVFARYHIPYAKHLDYELDHLIPRSLAGADSVANLWPQPLWQAKHQKDPLEVELGKRVCRGEMTLEFAQDAIVHDWLAAYRLYVQARPVTP